MPVSVVGINHRSAPVAIRERVAFAQAALPAALDELRQQPGVEGAAILSTCNRTEIYCQGTAGVGPTAWLLGQPQAADLDLRPHLYQLCDAESVRHLLRVASGLDSMVLGEPQILGQLKAAYQIAADQQCLGRVLNRLFQHAFRVAKKVRTDTAIGASPVSVAYAAVRLAQQIHGRLEVCTALLIGAGEAIELAASHLHDNGVSRMLIANRSVERAQALASRFGGYALALADLPQHLPEADIVVSSTAAPVHVLGRETIAQAMRARRHRPMFLVDIAVPRDIDPAAAALEDVYLYTIDDLQAVIEENMRSRHAAAAQALEIIDVETHHFLDWLRQGDAVDTVRRLRRHAEQVRDELLGRALQQIDNGQAPQQALERLAHQLTNRLLHTPTVKIKGIGLEGDDDLLRVVRDLYGLDQPDD